MAEQPTSTNPSKGAFCVLRPKKRLAKTNLVRENKVPQNNDQQLVRSGYKSSEFYLKIIKNELRKNRKIIGSPSGFHIQRGTKIRVVIVFPLQTWQFSA